MVTGYEVKAYADLAAISQSLAHLVKIMERISVSLDVIATQNSDQVTWAPVLSVPMREDREEG